jgi:hypothetical protein
MKQFLLFTVLTLACISLTAQQDTLSYTVISLKQAIDEKKVKTIITGSYNPKQYYRLSDGNGLHYGRCMDVILESQLDTFVVLKLDAGHSLVPEDSTFQTMYVTKTAEFPLYPNSTIPFSTYAMCGEIHDKAPIYGVSYSLGVMADSVLRSTIDVIEKEYLQNMIGQHMLWAVANNASKSELEKYGADSISLSRTVNNLKANNISCSLVNEVGVTKAEIKPAYMRIKKVTFYLGIAYMVILSAGMIFLAVKRYVRKDVSQQV